MLTSFDEEDGINTPYNREALINALGHVIPGELEEQGLQLVGLALKIDDWNVLLTIKATLGNDHLVAFIGSNSMINCILKAASEAADETLHWRADQYHPNGS